MPLKEPLPVSEINKRIKNPNKSEALLNFYHFRIPYTLQEEIKKYFDDLAKAGVPVDMAKCFKDCYKDTTLDKDDPRFGDFKRFYVKIKRGVESHPFTDEQLLKIVERGTYRTPKEIAIELFPETENSPTSEANKMYSYVAAIITAFGINYTGPKGDFTEPRITDSDYVPPETIEQVLRKINQHAPWAEWRAYNLDPGQKRCISFLRATLHSLRFLRTINSIRDVGLRELFEQEFIRNIYDKPESTNDEINGYITLSELTVDLYSANERMHILEKDFRDYTNPDDPKNSPVIRNKIGEQLTLASKQREDVKSSMQGWMKELKKIRDARKTENEARTQSIANYFLEFADQRKRDRAIISAKARNDELLAMMNEVEGYDGATKGEFNGISKDELFFYRFEPT